MKNLSLTWKRLNERYAALTRRERLLVAAALVLVPLLVVETLVLDPQRARNRALERSLAQQSASVGELGAQVTSLQQRLLLDPDAGAKAEIAALKAEQQAVESELQRLGTTLVRPEEMNGVLESLLAGHAGLRLISLKTLQPQSVLGGAEAAGAAGQPAARFDLYRHGVELRLEGSFADLQDYLKRLEQLPQRLLWGELQYEVLAYPKAEMRLTVHTLSADRSWLAL